MRVVREWKEIANLVWPAALSSVLFTLLEVADAAMLGGIGVEAMAGALLGSTIVYLVLVLPLQTVRAFTPLAAQQVAAATPLHELRRLLLRTSLALGLLAAGAVLLAATLLPSLGYQADLLSAAQTFLIWRAPFLPVELAFVSAWSTLEGVKGTRAPLTGGLATIAVNLSLNVLLIPGRLGLPALGVAGAALATNIATFVGLLVLLRKLGGDRAQRSPRDRDSQLWRRFLRIGWPLGLAGFLESAGWLLMGLLIARAGTHLAAVHGILAQLLALGLAVSQGVAAAGAVSVARALGRRDRGSARRCASHALKGQFFTGLLLALAVVLGGHGWLRIFTNDRSVSVAGGALLPLLGAMILADGLCLVLHGIIEGAGRTRVLLYATLIFDVGFVLLAQARLGSGADVSGLYAAWLSKSMLKLLFLLAWLQGWRWHGLLRSLASFSALRSPSHPRQSPVVRVLLSCCAPADDCWSALPVPDT